jgi:hypothetical protein
MTLVELMIALGIVGVVLLVCYSSSIALQRGFIYTSAWTEARINQARVLDSLAIDLRAATKIDPFPPSTSLATPAPLPITLTIPNRYTAYRSTYVAPGLRDPAAGDPAQTADPVRAPTPGIINSRTGSNIKYDSTNTIDIEYALSPDGTRITRKITRGMASDASRDVAIFPNQATVTFRASGPTTVITSVTTSPDYRHPENPSILEDTVFLREYSMNTPTPTPTP